MRKPLKVAVCIANHLRTFRKTHLSFSQNILEPTNADVFILHSPIQPATNELVTVLEGRLEMTVGDEVMTAEAGDEVFIPRNVLHSVKNVHTATTHWLYGYD